MKRYFTLLLFFFFLLIFAQNKAIVKANKQFDNYAYLDAIKIYEKVIQNGYESNEILEKLANSYYFNANYIKAAFYYKKLTELNKKVDPEYFFRYAQSLKSTQNYVLSDSIMSLFVQKINNDNRANNYKNQKDYLNLILDNSEKYEVRNAENNSKLSDYGSSFYNDKIVFVSTRDTSNVFKKNHNWNNQPFSNLFISDVQADGKLSNTKHFAKELNSKFHESTVVFSKDGKTMYFTRNEFKEDKKSNKNIKLLSIYKASLDNGKWTNIIRLPFCSDNFMTAHPALSNDEKTLYFSSNRDNSNGFGDLYKVSIFDDGSYGKPINLGDKINTKSRETFPFISKDNYLYFASDGHLGLGGLDVFASKINEDGSFQKPINLGKPINSEHDDFAFIINSDSKLGYLSSNRKLDNFGDDDIYFVKQISELECYQKIFGKVIDNLTYLPINNVKISLLNLKNEIIEESFTDIDGNYTFENQICGKNVLINFSKKDYLTTEHLHFLAHEKETSEQKITKLEKQVKQISKGDDLAKIFNIKMIYFDLDKYNIRPDAAVELNKILVVLQENPAINIQINSHTDSRNSHQYNKTLSQNRAVSTMNWLVKNGINQNRLKAIGFGETKLLNNCTDDEICTEEAHQLNRRSEFLIID